jgi:hypothetical protein
MRLVGAHKIYNQKFQEIINRHTDDYINYEQFSSVEKKYTILTHNIQNREFIYYVRFIRNAFCCSVQEIIHVLCGNA